MDENNTKYFIVEKCSYNQQYYQELANKETIKRIEKRFADVISQTILSLGECDKVDIHSAPN